jgi:hypothetical protein
MQSGFSPEIASEIVMNIAILAVKNRNYTEISASVLSIFGIRKSISTLF